MPEKVHWNQVIKDLDTSVTCRTWEMGVFGCVMWVPGTELISNIRAEHNLKHWDISVAREFELFLSLLKFLKPYNHPNIPENVSGDRVLDTVSFCIHT